MLAVDEIIFLDRIAFFAFAASSAAGVSGFCFSRTFLWLLAWAPAADDLLSPFSISISAAWDFEDGMLRLEESSGVL